MPSKHRVRIMPKLSTTQGDDVLENYVDNLLLQSYYIFLAPGEETLGTDSRFSFFCINIRLQNSDYYYFKSYFDPMEVKDSRYPGLGTTAIEIAYNKYIYIGGLLKEPNSSPIKFKPAIARYTWSYGQQQMSMDWVEIMNNPSASDVFYIDLM